MHKKQITQTLSVIHIFSCLIIHTIYTYTNAFFRVSLWTLNAIVSSKWLTRTMLLRNAINNINVDWPFFFLSSINFHFFGSYNTMNMNNSNMNLFSDAFCVLSWIESLPRIQEHICSNEKNRCENMLRTMCAIFSEQSNKNEMPIQSTCIYIRSFNINKKAYAITQIMAGTWTVCRFCETEMVCATKVIRNHW